MSERRIVLWEMRNKCIADLYVTYVDARDTALFWQQRSWRPPGNQGGPNKRQWWCYEDEFMLYKENPDV